MTQTKSSKPVSTSQTLRPKAVYASVPAFAVLASPGFSSSLKEGSVSAFRQPVPGNCVVRPDNSANVKNRVDPILVLQQMPGQMPKKRRRSLASEVVRKFHCDYPNCAKSYGSSPALCLHKKRTHRAANNPYRVNNP